MKEKGTFLRLSITFFFFFTSLEFVLNVIRKFYLLFWHFFFQFPSCLLFVQNNGWNYWWNEYWHSESFLIVLQKFTYSGNFLAEFLLNFKLKCLRLLITKCVFIWKLVKTPNRYHWVDFILASRSANYSHTNVYRMLNHLAIVTAIDSIKSE